MIHDLWYGTNGPEDAEIVIVGEAWGREEEGAKAPFIGESGRLLNRMLYEAGFNRKDILVTNTTARRPPSNEYFHFFNDSKEAKKYKYPEIAKLHPNDEVISEVKRLYLQINAYPRKLVIAVGNYALWALSDYTNAKSSKKSDGKRVPSGITTHRGSMYYMLNSRFEDKGYSTTPLLPIIHPASIMRNWTQKLITSHDLQSRVPLALKNQWRPNPGPTFLCPPTFDQAVEFLTQFLEKVALSPTRLACDIETVRHRFISCVGLTDRKDFAISIPLIKKLPDGSLTSYWSLEQETQIIWLLIRALDHENTLLEGQNFNYDLHYFQSHWGLSPKLDFDTLVAQHTLWPGFIKNLAFIASMYNDHYWYWKDDAKEDDEDDKEWGVKVTLEDHLRYNCMDLWHTFNAATILRSLVKEEKQEEQFEFEMWKANFALMMSHRGILVNRELRSKMSLSLITSMNRIHDWILGIIPQEAVDPDAKTLWFKSHVQKKFVFSEIMRLKIPTNYKTGEGTLNKEAMDELEVKYPFWSQLFSALKTLGSLGVFHSTFMQAPLDNDGRFRTFFKSAGPYTFRFASGKNPFGRGGNMQNIPEGDKE